MELMDSMSCRPADWLIVIQNYLPANRNVVECQSAFPIIIRDDDDLTTPSPIDGKTFHLKYMWASV